MNCANCGKPWTPQPLAYGVVCGHCGARKPAETRTAGEPVFSGRVQLLSRLDGDRLPGDDYAVILWPAKEPGYFEVRTDGGVYLTVHRANLGREKTVVRNAEDAVDIEPQGESREFHEWSTRCRHRDVQTFLNMRLNKKITRHVCHIRDWSTYCRESTCRIFMAEKFSASPPEGGDNETL